MYKVGQRNLVSSEVEKVDLVPFGRKLFIYSSILKGPLHIHGANTDRGPVSVRSKYGANTDKYGTNTVYIRISKEATRSQHG